MSADFAILTNGLSKSFGQTKAVDSLDLAVPRNGITAFLGRNGAGKSSTIKMLLGLIFPTKGDGLLLGHSIADPKANRLARKRVAYVAENKPLYSYMTVAQILRFASSFYDDWQPKVTDDLVNQYRLPLDRKVKALSKGMRTKLALLIALARRPDLMILDEPSEGLDPVGIEELLECLVAKAAEGTAVFFSSHQISEVERIADRVCILDQGRLKIDASLDDLRESYRRIDLVFSARYSPADFRLEGVEKVSVNLHGFTVLASGNADAVVERARTLNADSIEVTSVDLREIFLETVKEG